THSHPRARDVAMIVEVADASLSRDRSIKKRVYARAGVPVYWIVNLLDRHIEVYAEPYGAADTFDYRHVDNYGLAAEVPLNIEGRMVGLIPIAAILSADR